MLFKIILSLSHGCFAKRKKKRKEKKRTLEWKGGGGWEKEKAATAINVVGCMNCPCVRSLGDTPASERAPRMALAHWLSSEGLEKSGSGNKTVTFPDTARHRDQEPSRTSGSGRGDTQRPASHWGCPRECRFPLHGCPTLHTQYGSFLLVGTTLSSWRVF